VEQLYDHLNDVDVSRANVIRLNEGGGKARKSGGRGESAEGDDDQRNLFMEMCDPAVTRELISDHILLKRRLHLQALNDAETGDGSGPSSNMARLQEAEASLDVEDPNLNSNSLSHASSSGKSSSNPLTDTRRELRENRYINVKVVRKVLKDFSAQNSKDLLSRQLAQAGIDVEEEERARQALQMVAQASSKYKSQKNSMRLENFGKVQVAREGRMFMLKTFMLLTGDLGRSWRQFVEDNVRAEILRKKQIQARENEIRLNESMRTQRDRATHQRQLAYNNKYSNNAYLAGGSLEAHSVELSAHSEARGEGGDGDGDGDGASLCSGLSEEQGQGQGQLHPTQSLPGLGSRTTAPSPCARPLTAEGGSGGEGGGVSERIKTHLLVGIQRRRSSNEKDQ
jgi:hypothetical protein